MDELSLQDLLRRHQEGMAGATALSLLFGANYAVLKRLNFARAVTGATTGALFAGALWLFVAEYMALKVFFIVPVAFFSGYVAYPLLNAWVKKDDALADDITGTARGFLGRWFRNKSNGGTGDKL